MNCVNHVTVQLLTLSLVDIIFCNKVAIVPSTFKGENFVYTVFSSVKLFKSISYNTAQILAKIQNF